MKNYITYKEAADMLNKPEDFIRHKIGDVFTKVPSTSHKGLLIREQVALFQGKSQVSLRVLSAEERKEWEQYRDNELIPPSQNAVSNEDLDRDLAKRLIIKGIEEGRLYREAFLASVGSDIPPDIAELEKKRPLSAFGIQEFKPMSVFIQGYLKREYDLDIDRSDIAGFLAKQLYDMVEKAKQGNILSLIGAVILLILASRIPKMLPIEETAQRALEEVASEMLAS